MAVNRDSDDGECAARLQISDAARLQAAGLDTRLVAQRATEAYLMQVLKHGFLHSGARHVLETCPVSVS